LCGAKAGKGQAKLKIRKDMKKEKGFILIAVIFLLLFISILCAAMFYHLTKDAELIKDARERTRALYIAEAGVEEAIYNLRVDNTWTSNGSVSVEFPEESGNFYAVTYPVDSSSVQSVATMGDGSERTIIAEILVSGSASPYDVELNTWEDSQ